MVRKRQVTEVLPLFDSQLRQYQKDAQTTARADWRSGLKSLLIEMPTGTGKTRMFVTLPRDGARTLVIVPFISLIGQTVKAIRELRDCMPDIEQADLSALPESEFIVASWQTLHSNDRWKKFIGKVDLCVIDEAHWGFTTDARDVVHGLIEGGARVLGCTATAYRADKQSLLGLYEKVSYSYGLRTAIDDGYLVPPKCYVHYVKSVNLKGLRGSGTDFPAEELDRILKSESALHDIAQLYHKNHVPGKQAIMFCHSIKQAVMMQEILSDRYKVKANVVHSKMPVPDCREALKEYTDGKMDLIINVGMLTTGFDHPPVAECYIAKPTRAISKFTQMIGRCTRTLKGVIDDCNTAEERKAAIAASDKPHFVIHDITDSSRSNKIVSCLDIMTDHTKEMKAKVRRKNEEKPMDLEEIDACVAEEIEAEKQQALLEREAERKRREKLVVDLEFDKEERDIFLDVDRDTPKRREFRFPFGKFRGQPLRVIPMWYLTYALENFNLTPFWKQVVGDHVHVRKRYEEKA